VEHPPCKREVASSSLASGSSPLPTTCPQPSPGCPQGVCLDQQGFGVDLGRVPLGQVHLELALDALEGVVDRLHVAAELLADLLVGPTLDVQAEDVDLEA